MSNDNARAAYVRTEMLPEQAPPTTAAGPIKWLRENLFSSIPNAIMTILALYVVYYVLSHTLGWMVYGIWDAGSLTECRAIRDGLIADGTWAEHTEVACWAVLSDRWHQLLFGFYPPEHYWRPILSLILFGIALAPVLFDGVSRKLFIVTLLTPFIAYFLLWGGTIWGPLVVLSGFALGFAIIKYGSLAMGTLLATLAAIVLPLLFWLFLASPITGVLNSIAPIGIEAIPSDDFGGFLLAFVIGAAGIILSMPLGVVLALGRQSDLFIINKFSVIFIEVIRGVPLIVWLFTASLLLNYFLPPSANFDLMLRVIIMVTLFSAAYIAEVIRGGLAALPRGQYEGADSLGLNYWQAMQLIILPQALKISIPGIVSSFIGLFKDTVLVVFVGLSDPIGFSNLIRATTDWNGIYWELFIFIGLCFFIVCFGMSRYSQYLERKLATGHR
jgi:general L-amino acid transport system permease protein